MSLEEGGGGGGVSQHLSVCKRVGCLYGRCVLVNGEPSCECKLGYMGNSCEETINDALSVPLTIGVLVVIIIFIVLMFGLAFLRQKQKAKKRKKRAEEALIRNGSLTCLNAECHTTATEINFPP